VIDLVLVDFDDSLVDTAPRLQIARRELFRLLLEHGFTVADTHRVHPDDVDPVMRKQFGLGPARMEPAFRATYEALCRLGNQPIDPAIAERAAEIGRAVAGSPPVFDGALVALTRLSSALPTALYTQSGDHDYQFGCVRDAGILEILPLERVRVVARKTTEQFRTILAEFDITDPATVWMVGNSMRSDINPAVEAGANAVYIETADPWEFDMVEPFSDGFHTVGSFPEAVDFLLAQQR
jgi:putative hydrolase of the HAD superfamily